jgi:hypothetical protein
LAVKGPLHRFSSRKAVTEDECVLHLG